MKPEGVGGGGRPNDYLMHRTIEVHRHAVGATIVIQATWPGSEMSVAPVKERVYEFDTAWCAPMGVISHLRERFPQLEIRWLASDEHDGYETVYPV